jgi:hypothetical protein
MKDAVATMGGLLPEDAGGRDAVHVAVFSATSSIALFPGQDVSLVETGGRDETVAPGGADAIGIVDPFLRRSVQPGCRFWVYLYPRTITALSHRWDHPAWAGRTVSIYAPPSAKLASEEWLRNFITYNLSLVYEEVLALAAKRADRTDDDPDYEYLVVFGSNASGEIPDEFWNHVEIVIGRPIRGARAKYFSCSC